MNFGAGSDRSCSREGNDDMPRWNEADLADYQARRDGNRPRPVIQKQQDVDARTTDNRPQKTEVDGEGRSFYRVTVKLLVSDRRARDADGAISTLLDCLIAAVGRQLGMDRRAMRKLATSEERRRRRGAND